MTQKQKMSYSEWKAKEGGFKFKLKLSKRQFHILRALEALINGTYKGYKEVAPQMGRVSKFVKQVGKNAQDAKPFENLD